MGDDTDGQDADTTVDAYYYIRRELRALYGTDVEYDPVTGALLDDGVEGDDDEQ